MADTDVHISHMARRAAAQAQLFVKSGRWTDPLGLLGGRAGGDTIKETQTCKTIACTLILHVLGLSYGTMCNAMCMEISTYPYPFILTLHCQGRQRKRTDTCHLDLDLEKTN